MNLLFQNIIDFFLTGDYNRSRDDERQPAGKGRGRGRKNVANDDKPPIILKKHEEQKPVVSI